MAHTKQRVTNLEMRRLALMDADQAALALTGYTDGDIATYKYETGLKYLEGMVRDPEARAYLEGSREYWNWWKNQWCLRDEEFLPPLCAEMLDYQDRGGAIMRADIREGYSIIHSIDILLDMREPNSLVLANSFRCLVLPKADRTQMPERAA